MIPQPITIDFETESIERRPYYPPKPVGYSIKKPGAKKSTYYAWGHPTANNCTFNSARAILFDAWRSGAPLLFQNAKFDVDVGQVHMGMPDIDSARIHDTMFLLFLHDPHAPNFKLKPSAERILGMPSEERDAVKDWLMLNCPEAKRKPKDWGGYICRAPGDVVGRYADGDVVRTEKLFAKLYPDIQKRCMLPAYDRERQLMPILLQNEREGVRIDLLRLEADFKVYSAAMAKAEAWLRTHLNAKDLNLDADRAVADVLEREGVVTEWVYTKNGQKSVAKQNMTSDTFNDQQVAQALQYRNKLKTCLSMFMEPWLNQARETGGWVHTEWRQVRQTHGGESNDNEGARTGRMSSSPNFQNVIKNWKRAMAEGYVHPKFLRVPQLPLLRVYFLPDSSSHLWGRRDYNQQELRILGHYEDGALLERYLADPRLDIHALVQKFILEIVGLDLPRDPVKILNFADIYGRGLAQLAIAMNVDVALAARLRKAKAQLLPGIDALNNAIKYRGRTGAAIRTWGGREYYCEAPAFSKKLNRPMTFEYKLLNYLVQGSAADCTKEAMIRYHNHPKRNGRLTVSVHDEIDISHHKTGFKQEMLLLKECMMSVEFDLPMLSDGEYGPNWSELKALEE